MLCPFSQRPLGISSVAEQSHKCVDGLNPQHMPGSDGEDPGNARYENHDETQSKVMQLISGSWHRNHKALRQKAQMTDALKAGILR